MALPVALMVFLALASVAFIPRFFLKDHMFLFAPPLRVWVLRLQAILSPKEKFPLNIRIVLFLRWWLLLVDQVVWHFLWTLDDILFPQYRDIDLTGSVFIVGKSKPPHVYYDYYLLLLLLPQIPLFGDDWVIPMPRMEIR